MQKVALLFFCLTIMAAQSVLAKDISFDSGLAQESFKKFTEDAGGAIAYRNAAPAAPMGITGFDIGVEVSAVVIDKDSAYWQSAFGSDAPTMVYIPRVRVRKGLPLGIDIGVSYTEVPESNIRIYGAELGKALLEGTIGTPAIGLRATYSKLSNVNDLSLQTAGLDASISKGFLFFTPYAGAGVVWIDGKAEGNLQALSTAAPGLGPLTEEKLYRGRYFAGLQITPFPLLRILGEAEFSAQTVYTLKIAAGF